MKLIHCADLHLDSAMKTHLDSERAKERKGELLQTFRRMVEYAVNNQVDGILIAGDLFDTKKISAVARNEVWGQIKNNPGVIFFYLRGNHDNDNFFDNEEAIPNNLKLFSPDKWLTYSWGDLRISGIEISSDNNGSIYHQLSLDNTKFNIVMLHGQESQSDTKDKTEVINLKALRGKGIDYLALGHIHDYREGVLDARGTYCYSGCLEGRGFDECGSHGFVLLDIDTQKRTYTRQFVHFAHRSIHAVSVNISDNCETTFDVIRAAEREIKRRKCANKDMLRLVLTGEVDVETEISLSTIETAIRDQFYFVKVVDETKAKLDYEKYRLDASLKGEYVRTVFENNSIPDEYKATVIRYGLQALAGEEIQ